MPLRKLILRFLLRFAVIFGLLILPWPGWSDTYAGAFRAVGNAIFGCDQPDKQLHFEAHVQTKGFSALDSRIVLVNRAITRDGSHNPAVMLGLDTRSIGWVPTALTIALILGTPLPFRRLVLPLVCGLVLIHLFIIFSIAIYIWNESTTVSLVSLSPFVKEIASDLEYTLITQLGISFTIPVLIWIVTVFRREDLARWK